MSKKKTSKSKGTVKEMELEKTDPIVNGAGQEAADADQEAIDGMGSEVEAIAPEGADQKADETVLEEARDQTREAELAEALEAARAKQEEYLNMAQRVQADFDNFRRRNQNVRKEAFDDGARTLVISLLPVLDNLERAIDAAKDSSDASLREGVEMVFRQLGEVFTKRGILPICRPGEKFDPNLENAVLQGAAEDGEPGTVCEVFQKGYQMGDIILRHAMVKVVPE